MIQITEKNQKYQTNSAISHHKTTTIITAHSMYRANLNKKSGFAKKYYQSMNQSPIQIKSSQFEILETWAHYTKLSKTDILLSYQFKRPMERSSKTILFYLLWAV